MLMIQHGELREQPIDQLPVLGQQHNLDIVRDCSDLAGTFPDNVEIKFVLWQHGQYLRDEDGKPYKTGDPLTSLVPHLIGADIVAKEMAVTDFADSKRETEENFDVVNEIIDGRRRGGTIRELLGEEYARSTISYDLIHLWEGIAKAGATKPTYFTAVDSYGGEVPEPDWATLAATTMVTGVDYALELNKYHRQREALVLRQLNLLANAMAEDGQPHVLAAVFGTMHDTLPIATRTLGAKTSKVYVSGALRDPDSYLRKMLRFSDDPEVIKALTDIYNMGSVAMNGIFRLSEDNDLDVTGLLTGKDFNGAQKVLGHLFAKVAAQQMTGKRKLTANQLRMFEDNYKVLEEYTDSTDLIPEDRKSSAIAAMTQILNLAVDPAMTRY